MDIVWFQKTPKGRGNAASDKAYKITFTDKPKGVRCNVALTRKLSELGSENVQMGLQDDVFIIRPITGLGAGFKLITNKSSAQVCAASIGEWALSRSLIRKRAIGVWNAEQASFVFNLSGALEDSDEAAEEALESAVNLG